MRAYRFSCGTVSLILTVLLLALTIRGPVLTAANFVLLGLALAAGNAWAWIVADERSQHRYARINRRMTTVLAAHDLDQIGAAITTYRETTAKGDNN